MKLDELLHGSESEVTAWLRKRNLLHECDCGYTVYDEDAVADEVQQTFGDKRAQEINQWSWNLSNVYGWLWLDESSDPKLGIYHCQHCAASEWSHFLDLEKRMRAGLKEKAGGKAKPKVKTPGEPCVIYVDESYSDQFPRKPEGSLSFAAFIVPESAVERVRRGVEDIIAKNYRGASKPAELKYTRVAKHGGLRERIGQAVADLIKSVPGSAVLAIYVPRSGLFGEQRRALRAVGHYSGKPPSAEELAAVESPEAVEDAVRKTANSLAQTLATCVANHLAARNARGRIVFDPRNKRADEPLIDALEKLLPLTPVNAPLFPHQDAVVSVPPSRDMERLGDRVKVEIVGSSHETHGLQVADFIAGDVRTFFEEVPELLTEATSDEPLVNKRLLLPQFFRQTKLSRATLKKAQTPGKSALPLYRERLASDQLSCYANNGQMRNIDLAEGVIYDIMD